jgi:Rrf2 family protein
MSRSNVQFSVGVHMIAVLGYYDEPVKSATLAKTVAAEPNFVRHLLSKLVKAGLVNASRGKNGACRLSRPDEDISFLEIYRASAAPGMLATDDYPVDEVSLISCKIKQSLSTVLGEAQGDFERALASRSLADIVADIREREG